MRGNADTQRIAQRTGNIAADDIAFLFEFIRAFAAHFPDFGGLFRTHGEHTGRGAFSKEQRLRTLEHIDLLHIEKAGLDEPHRAQLDPIEVERDGRIERCRNGRRADPAQRNRTAGTRSAGLDAQGRNAVADLFNLGRLIAGNQITADRGDRDWHFLQRFGRFAGNNGDNGDVPEIVAIGGGSLCKRSAGHDQATSCGSDQQVQFDARNQGYIHDALPSLGVYVA